MKVMSCSKTQYLALKRKFGPKTPTKQPTKQPNRKRKTSKPIIEEEITDEPITENEEPNPYDLINWDEIPDVTSDLNAVGYKPNADIDEWLRIAEREITKKPITNTQTTEELPEEQTTEELPEEQTTEELPEEQTTEELRVLMQSLHEVSKAKNI